MTKLSKTKILFFLVFFFGIFGLAKSSWAACPTGHECVRAGTTWTCPDVSYDCVNAITTSPSYDYGDIIYLSGTSVPSATWTNTLVLTKGGGELRGAGRDTITITFTSGSYAAPAIEYAPDTNSIANNRPFKISGIKIDGGSDNLNNVAGVKLSNANTSTPITKVIVTGMTFSRMKWALYIIRAVYGVGYHNNLDNIGIPMITAENDQATWDAFVKVDWTKDATSQSDCASVDPTASCFFYMEDNNIYWHGNYTDSFDGFTYTGQGNRMAVRYNTYDYTNIYTLPPFTEIFIPKVLWHGDLYGYY